MSNNLAQLILANRSSLSTLIAAYDAETATAEIEFRQRVAQAEASYRTNTEAATAHFEEGLRLAGITLFDLEPQEDAPDFANVGHLPEPLRREVHATWEAQRNATEETPGRSPESAIRPGDSGGDDLAGQRDSVPVRCKAEASGDVAAGGDDAPEPAGGVAEASGLAVDAPLCANCGKAISPSFVKQGLKKCWRCYGKKSTAMQSPEQSPEEKPIHVAPEPTPVEILPCKTNSFARQSLEDLFDPSTPAPDSPAEGDIPDYLKAVALANRMPEPDRTLLNTEIHAGLVVYKPRRFEIHQDIATGAYYAVDFRHEVEPGSRAILWIQYHEGKPYPTFYPEKGGGIKK